MNNIMKKTFQNEGILYLIFGVAATLVYMVARILLFAFLNQVVLVAFLANVIAILFAFITNDQIVFRQESRG